MDQAVTLDFETSASTEKLDASLAKAQGAFRTAAKDKVNPHFRSRYADLESVWDACRDALSANGVSVTQWPVHSTDGRAHLITRLASAGEWMRGHFSIPVSKGDAHGYGSAITYLKRFSLAAALGIASGEDDDGNGATGRRDDPIAEAKQTAITEDRHLLVNGDERSTYDVRKAQNGGKTDYMANKEKEIYEWLNAALKEIPTLRDVEEWWDHPDRHKKIEWMRKNMPKQHVELCDAAERRIAQLKPTEEYRA